MVGLAKMASRQPAPGSRNDSVRLPRKGTYTYRINCDCASYLWTRKPAPPGRFMRCRGCGRSLGDFQVAILAGPAPTQSATIS